jgi:hypothetical protein
VKDKSRNWFVKSLYYGFDVVLLKDVGMLECGGRRTTQKRWCCPPQSKQIVVLSDACMLDCNGMAAKDCGVDERTAPTARRSRVERTRDSREPKRRTPQIPKRHDKSSTRTRGVFALRNKEESVVLCRLWLWLCQSLERAGNRTLSSPPDLAGSSRGSALTRFGFGCDPAIPLPSGSGTACLSSLVRANTNNCYSRSIWHGHCLQLIDVIQLGTGFGKAPTLSYPMLEMSDEPCDAQPRHLTPKWQS